MKLYPNSRILFKYYIISIFHKSHSKKITINVTYSCYYKLNREERERKF